MKNRRYDVEHLTEILLGQKVISDEQAREIVQKERVLRERVLRKHAKGAYVRRFGSYRVSPVEVVEAAAFQTADGRALSEDRIMQSIAQATGLEYRKIDPLKLNERLITDTMNRAFARRHVCLPLEKDAKGKIVFAIDNPFDLGLQESLRQLAPAGFGTVLTSKTDILRIITDVYGFRSAIRGAERDLEIGTDLGNLEQLVKLKSVEDIESNDKHIVNAVEYLLHYAFAQRASDIHIEPKRDEGHVRLRIDGVLHTLYSMPRTVHNAVVSRIKTLARLDIAERRKPQDGRIKTDREGEETELRVSTLPVAFGEKVVIRIFDPQMLLQDLEQLGFFRSELETYQSFLQAKSGIVLITGPTGSGKTTTLYSTLKMLADPDVNVCTIEDPIEMIYEPFNQVLVRPKIGLDYAAVLRHVLRQDPDIIMIGEIRDPETAEMAVQAALTGHLVFSTLHTNDAPSAITRLQDLGVKDFLLSSTVVGVMAQRLLRKVCEYCKAPAELTEDEAAMLGIEIPPGQDQSLPVFIGEGCHHCRGTGLYGRTGVYEVMPVDARVRALVHDGADADQLRTEARANGMTTLKEAAIHKLALGVTSFAEVMRVVADG